MKHAPILGSKYKTMPLNLFMKMNDGRDRMYLDFKQVVDELLIVNYEKLIDWKTPYHIKNESTKEKFEIAAQNFDEKGRRLAYQTFIGIFLAKFIYENNLIINLDAVRLFQADFLGWNIKNVI